MKERSLLSSAVFFATQRPLRVYASVRCYLLFLFTRWASHWFLRPRNGITLGRNVRLQRLSCLSAQRPTARIDIGDHCIIYENARIEAYGSGQVEIGECSILGDVRIYSRFRIRIGKRLVSSWNVMIQDYDSHPPNAKQRGEQIEHMAKSFRPRFDGETAPGTASDDWQYPGAEIEIGDDVWLGANCIVLKGTRIGSGSIIAAGAVVPGGDYPERSLIAGNPGRVVKALDP